MRLNGKRIVTKETILIVNSFGPDRPGIVASFLKVLLENEIERFKVEEGSGAPLP